MYYFWTVFHHLQMKRVNTRFTARAPICSICLDSIEFQGVLDSCKHSYCYGCIVEWSKVRFIQFGLRCPLCMAFFTKITRRALRTTYNPSQQPLMETCHNFESTDGAEREGLIRAWESVFALLRTHEEDTNDCL